MPELTSLTTYMSGDSKSFVYPRVLALQRDWWLHPLTARHAEAGDGDALPVRLQAPHLRGEGRCVFARSLTV